MYFNSSYGDFIWLYDIFHIGSLQTFEQMKTNNKHKKKKAAIPNGSCHSPLSTQSIKKISKKLKLLKQFIKKDKTRKTKMSCFIYAPDGKTIIGDIIVGLYKSKKKKNK